MPWLLILWPPLAFLLVLAGASALAVRRGATSSETVGAFVEARVSLWLAVTLALVGATLAGLVAVEPALADSLAAAILAGRPELAVPAGVAAGAGIAGLYFGGLDTLVRQAQARFGDYVPAGSTTALGAGGAAFVVANVVLAPVVEELWYRGLLFDALAPELSLAAAAVAGCAAFGLLHWPGGAWYVLVTGALVGGVCWALRAWDGGLSGPIAAHLTLNLIETVVLRRAARRAAASSAEASSGSRAALVVAGALSLAGCAAVPDPVPASPAAPPVPLLDASEMACRLNLTPEQIRADSLNAARGAWDWTPTAEIVGGIEALVRRAGRPTGTAGVDADVVLSARTDRRGHVVEAAVVRSTDRRFEAGALRAMAESRFVPGMARGPAEAWRCVVSLAFR